MPRIQAIPRPREGRTRFTPSRSPGFPGALSKTLESGACEVLLGDVSSQLFGVCGDDTVVYPGHGDEMTLGEERPHLQEWRERGW